MIIFENIRYKNLLSTGNSWNEVQLNKAPTTLIVGTNGHGKSTLLDALCLALFGKPFRNINKPNLVNSINEKDCVVELQFSIGNKIYKIIRGIAPSIFKIVIDGVPLDQDAMSKDAQAYLEENILKFNYKAFTQIVILGSKSFVPFMKLKTNERRGIIENLLDIEIFSSMNKIAKDQLKKAKDAVTDNKIELDKVQTQITLQEKYEAESKKNNDAEIQTKRDEILAQQAKLAELAVKEKDLSANIQQLRADTADRSKLEDKLTEMSVLKSKINSKKNKAEEDLEFYSSNDDCPTCRQPIDYAFKSNAISSANGMKSTMAKNLVKWHEQYKIYNDKLDAIRDITEQYHDAISKMNALQASRSHITSTINKLDSEILALSKKNTLSDDMVALNDKLIKERQNLTAERKKFLDDVAYYKAAVDLLMDGGIKAQIIKQYLPVINSLVNKYLTAMDFFVSFELNEEFEETIKSRHRDKFTYDSFSDGERQRIDIALLFAWRAVAKLKNSINTNLLIMDEIFDSSLDGNGADLVLSILNTLPQGSNVFVVSHRELLNDRFSEIIKFEKKNNFSEIVNQEN